MITARNITREYTNGRIVTKVLKGIDLEVQSGEWLAIMGKSGAGKSTFMYQLSALDTPTSGSVVIDDVDITALPDSAKTDFRLRKLGYVFQNYALLPELNAVENVLLPLLMQGYSWQKAGEIASASLERIGLGHRLDNRPSQLSGGEQQRVSIARAVAQNPKILFADEPTANLDNMSSEAVIDVMRDLHKDGQTIVMVTHEKEYTTYCDRIVYLDDGKIVEEEHLR